MKACLLQNQCTVPENTSRLQDVHPMLKANSPQYQNISSLHYLSDIIDLDHLSTKSDISNYVDVQGVMYFDVHFSTKKTYKVKELIQRPHQKKIKVNATLLCETFLHTEALKLVQIPNFSL